MNLLHEKLAEEHIKLAHFLANKNHDKCYEYEEIFSVALTGLAKAIRNFDESRGFKFSTFAYRTIENEILKFYKAMNAKMRKGKTVSVETVIHDGSKGRRLTLLDVLVDSSDEDKEPWEDINFFAVNTVLRQLKERDKKILVSYLSGKSQTAISVEVGLAQAHVSRIIRRAFAKIKEEYWRYAA